MTDYLRDFILANTGPMSPPILPEIRLYLAAEPFGLWHMTEKGLEKSGLPAPYWAFAWAGGQALARHVLDNPELVRGRRVVDLASGSGVVAIAAARAGAAEVVALDTDPFACVAMQLNAAANDVTLDIRRGDPLDRPPPDCDVLLVGDFFFDRETSPRAEAWCRAAAKAGVEVVVGDPGRKYLPKEGMEALGEYPVPSVTELEAQEFAVTRIWRMSAIGQTA